MIGQYLLNKNESATVPKRKKICKVNKALCWLIRPVMSNQNYYYTSCYRQAPAVWKPVKADSGCMPLFL